MIQLQRLGVLFFSLILLLVSEAFGGTPFSNRELDQLEKLFVEEINQSPHVFRDPLLTQYINHLGARLARNTEEKAPYFFIVKSNEINAFAGPGGYIGVHSQLILATETESELAGVMSHEMAHERLHHLYRMIEHQKQMRLPTLASVLASMALGMINPTLGQGALMASLGGLSQDSINFTRANEKEADRIGIDMLIHSGLDPRGMSGFFKKMQMNSRYYYTDNIPAILRTHPLDNDRIAEAENRIAHLSQKPIPSSVDYTLFKEQIRSEMISNPKQLLDYYSSACLKANTPLACQYGLGLALIKTNQFTQAKQVLAPLLKHDPNHLAYNLALANAELGNQEVSEAIQRLENLQHIHPENYAALVSYGQILLAGNQPKQAASTLLKARRLYKHDLLICESLAKAQAASHQKAYAYFTLANCEQLQGHTQVALRQLKHAKKLAQKDPLLSARIQASLDEISYLLNP